MPFRSALRARLAESLGLTLVLLLMMAAFGLATDHFFTATTLRTIANQVPDAIFVAVGMSFVLIIAGLDLSVGSVLGFCGAVLGFLLTRAGMPLWVAMAASVAVGALCGALNGLIIVRWSLPAFIVTLGMLEAARGGTYLVSHSRTAYIGQRIEALGEVQFGGLSLLFFLAVACVVLGHLVLRRTVFGRYMVAVGTNEEAVRLSGIDPRPIKVAVYVISGALTGLAAVSNVSRLGAADPNAGVGFELNAIAAVVIGGTSLLGGRGSVINSFFGVLIIAVLENGLAQMGVREPTKRVVTGCVIVAAVVLDYYRTRFKRSSSSHA
jgi:ribose transport system permease protein